MSEHKWQEIASSIRDAVEGGRLRAGDRVPAERDLADEWSVSRMTVHRALQELQRQGWVLRRRGVGTVVAGPEARMSRRIAMMYYSDASVLEAAYLQGVRSAMPEEMHLLICVHRDDPKLEARLIHRMSHETDGIILLGTGATENHAVIQRAADEGLAIVCIDRAAPELQVDSVVTDNYGVTLDALRHVIAHGHSRIAHFTADLLYVSACRERYEAYLQACREAGVDDPSRLIRVYPVQDTARRDLIARLVADALAAMMAGAERPTAAFCLNEYLLAPLLEACDEMRVSIPDDLEVVSFNDSLNLMRRHERAVHRIVQRPAEAGRIAVELLLQRLEDRSRPRSAIRLPADFHPAALATPSRDAVAAGDPSPCPVHTMAQGLASPH